MASYWFNNTGTRNSVWKAATVAGPEKDAGPEPAHIARARVGRIFRHLYRQSMQAAQKKAPPKRGLVHVKSIVRRYSLLAADWRAMKLSKVFSATRNHSTSSLRKGFQDS